MANETVHGVQHLLEMRQKAFAGGGVDKQSAERAEGKLTARERIELLLDPNSFAEVYTFAQTFCTDFGMEDKHYPGDGLITGFGRIDGRKVCVLAHDVTVLGGSGTSTHLRKWCEIIDNAVKMGVPVIQVNESGRTSGSLYRTGTQDEIEATVKSWLQETIRRLESEAVSPGAER